MLFREAAEDTLVQINMIQSTLSSVKKFSVSFKESDVIPHVKKGEIR